MESSDVQQKPGRWDPKELTYLVRAAKIGLHSGEVADDLGRPEESVRKAARKMRIKIPQGWP